MTDTLSALRDALKQAETALVHCAGLPGGRSADECLPVVRTALSASLVKTPEVIADLETRLQTFDEDPKGPWGYDERDAKVDRKVLAALSASEAEMEGVEGLKPCPFCGGEARLIEGADGESAFIQCLMMSAHKAIFFDGDNNAANDVVEQWNRRA